MFRRPVGSTLKGYVRDWRALVCGGRFEDKYPRMKLQFSYTILDSFHQFKLVEVNFFNTFTPLKNLPLGHALSRLLPHCVFFFRSVLLVKLDSAQNLPTKDEELLPAVYVKTQLVPSRKRVYISKVHRDTVNPVFNESYEFDIEYQELQQQTLVFQILDYDCMSRYKSIGEVTVHLAELGTHGFNILREISLCVYISRPRTE